MKYKLLFYAILTAVCLNHANNLYLSHVEGVREQGRIEERAKRSQTARNLTDLAQYNRREKAYKQLDMPIEKVLLARGIDWINNF